MDSVEQAVEDALTQLFVRAHAQFGSAVRGRWLYDGDCPGCGRPVDGMRHKGQAALSLNAFIYRRRGMLIGYLLCGRCAKLIFREAQRRPGQQTARHAVIEATLSAAYEAHMNGMDA